MSPDRHRGALDHLYEAERLLAQVKLPVACRDGRNLIANARNRLQAAILMIDSGEKLRPT